MLSKVYLSLLKKQQQQQQKTQHLFLLHLIYSDIPKYETLSVLNVATLLKTRDGYVPIMKGDSTLSSLALISTLVLQEKKDGIQLLKYPHLLL